MPVAPGQVNGVKCTVLRDSGCSSVIVKRGLVASTVPRVGTQQVCLADGSTRRVPTAVVFIDCPYYKGSVKAALLDEPLYDVILGNIKGVKCPGFRANESLNSQEAATVETRAASKRESKMFKTPKVADLGLSEERLKVLQQKDPTLEQAKKIAEVGDKVHTDKASKSWFSYQRGVLVRYFNLQKLTMGIS
ncbi:hypothetical protein RRG08_035164 [Elysia crispata]|uniref:Uncharacterized protein n=1 Tax=Elysia crispata TaxID=231223 RepID=A0AAE1B860_9GAST|nr:hypothetical protein RRG08_035164 [Elysia crispata]